MTDINLDGVFVPPLFIIFVACLALAGFADRLLAMTGAYRLVWHPALFRACLFVCLFGAVALHYYE